MDQNAKDSPSVFDPENHPELYEEKQDKAGRTYVIALPDKSGVKHCRNCGDSLSNRNKCYCLKAVDRTCPECGKTFTMKCDRSTKIRLFCSTKCAMGSATVKEKREETVLERYGVTSVIQRPDVHRKAIVASTTPEALEKKKVTNRERYGADYPAQNPEINEDYLARQRAKNGGLLAFNTEKQKKTNRERYGGNSPFSSPEVQAKAQAKQKENNGGVLGFNNEQQRATMLEKYGSAGRLGSKEEQTKQRSYWQERHGVDYHTQVPEIKARILATTIERHGHLFGSGRKNSKINIDFGERIQRELGLEVEYEKQVGPALFDIHIPTTNLIIDINPTVTHNSTLPFPCLRKSCPQPCGEHSAINSKYHYARSVLARAEGYRLIQIYEWDGEKTWDFVAGKLRRDVKKLSARKLSVAKISQSSANKFLEDNHIQGKAKLQSHCYGLSKGGELISVATFGKSRFNRNYQYEFIRFATASGFIIHGGAEKLFKAFCADACPESMVSYIDFNHTTQPTFMENLGFAHVRDTGPDLFWSKKGSSIAHRNTTVLKLGADRVLGTNYGSIDASGLNNEKIMLSEGWMKVHTAGNQVYQWLAPAQDDKIDSMTQKNGSK